ncbi:hypothetical protein BJV78DRAFT_1200777 [Lactifluus subvellereus]|nr:hypothetical protein BJV78DRAFT_1200777 [Lactifluus subvellereus]
MSASFLQRRARQSPRVEQATNLFLAQSTVRKHRTISFAELPEWMKDNEFILTGYRGEMNSWGKCLKSVFGYLHNETGTTVQSHAYCALMCRY